MALPDYRRPRLAQGRRGRVALAAHLDALAAAVEREPVRVIVPPSPPSPYIGEQAFQQIITDLATLCAWEHFHALDSRGDDPGWPDLVLGRAVGGQGQVIFREVKTERGKLSLYQERWGRLLLVAGLDWQVWRPSSWAEIVKTLTQEVR